MIFPESLCHYLFLNLIAYSFYIKYKQETAPTPNSSEPQYIFHSPQNLEPCKTRSSKSNNRTQIQAKAAQVPKLSLKAYPSFNA